MKEFITLKHVLSTWNPSMGTMGGMGYLYPHYINFIEAFKKLNQEVNGDRVYTEKDLSVYIFTLNFNGINSHWVKEYFKRKIYVANSYIENLNNKFDGNTILDYLPQLGILCQDLDILFDEIYTNKIVKEVTKYGRTYFRWRRKFPFRIYEDAYSFLNIKDFTSIDQLHFYELEQYSIFAMRQLIEETGKAILGVLAIRDKYNNPNKDTEVTWSFIEMELKKTESRILIPFDISIISTIKSWCNNFIHTTENSPIYIIWQALEMVKVLVKRNTEPVVIYSGATLPISTSLNVRIYQYNLLKSDFEGFANQRERKADKRPLNIYWIDYTKYGIEGFVMSL